MTLVLYGLLAIIIAGLLFLVASRFLPAGEQIAPPLRDEAPWNLPADRVLFPEDVDSIRLPVALRGYRFAETDILLDRLAGELRDRDAEIARLRGTAPRAVGEQPGPAEPAALEQVDVGELDVVAVDQPAGVQPAGDGKAVAGSDSAGSDSAGIDPHRATPGDAGR